MIRRVLALLMALLLMAAFYVYALLREDEQTKQSEEWLVKAQELPFEKMGGLDSTDPAALARAMQMAVMLPQSLVSGAVRDAAYHAAYARLLTASDGSRTVWGVRPASASPLIRPPGLHFESTGQSLHSYPLLRARDDAMVYYYLATGEQGAFVIGMPLSMEGQGLQGIEHIQPE